MPKRRSERTFAACWTCRRRNVRCDKTVPYCLECKRLRLRCEGYHNRLVWVDSGTGEYSPQQRRTYPCDQTWKGYPSWTLKEVSHLIDDCDRKRCRCKLHRVQSPFGVFLYRDQMPQGLGEEGQVEQSTPEPPPRTETRQGFVTPTASTIDTNDRSLAADRTPPSLDEFPLRSVADQENRSDLDFSPATNWALVRTGDVELSSSRDLSNILMLTGLTPSLSLTSRRNREENELFHHYVIHTSVLMMPIDDGRNPWKSTYPSIAVRDRSSSSSRSLYYAIMAQSTLHLEYLRTPNQCQNDQANALQYMDVAICELRRSLTNPAEDYSAVLAALLTITLVEHVFLGKSQGWRQHLQGAKGFVIQYLQQKPWMLSHDAWIITQNFILSIIIAQTVGDCSMTLTSQLSELFDVVSDVTTRPNCGFTIGGTAVLLRALYKTRLLEEQMAALGYTPDPQGLDADLRLQVQDIVQQLQCPLSHEVEAYLEQCEPDDMAAQPRGRMLVKLHLHLFNRAVMIYLFRVVLKYPPSSVAWYVWEALTDIQTFIDMHDDGTAVSIWPVFIATTEACTPEARTLANHLLGFYKDQCGNRKDLPRVVREIWEYRDKLALEQQCDPGGVVATWREALRRADADLLLL
ncbi:uncharacterized protein Z518_02056 [Rhinocladiella mackenziei CBS 650.93]|uniref:Rhinocladiella mackenziei CBS 650.93 unplaced genomic scaffold supercont1.2, whole genome shotgun sequence n=1 Tax=Rhinocladiella mackenziei CBS 650.93 TaxID=1442369 RepID=A0A0D2HAA4_9EURO|nr:uncharacterized protein Z518_02056 [Rhinocladiella mackenziei CBS 650.93]KIX07403.1 hypothetical protein Z518_02056 [Rhinocladiella mackenziei CBS 650.93]